MDVAHHSRLVDCSFNTNVMMTNITWNISPIIIQIFGIPIRWYGLLFAVSFILGYQIMEWIYAREKKTSQDMDQLFLYLLGGTIIGARLGHCFFYDPGYYLDNPLKILAVWEGGLASHGGGIGILIGLFLYRVKTQESYFWLLDRVCIPVSLAAFFIRIGNLFNSEIIGVPTKVPWAIIFQRVDPVPRHPAQVYEAISYLLTFLILMFIYKKNKSKTRPGLLFGIFLILVFTARFFIEFFKTQQEAYSWGFWMNTGQMLSLPFWLAGLVLVFMAFKKTEKKQVKRRN